MILISVKYSAFDSPFNHMLKQYYKELFNYLSHTMGDRESAADITQETFTRALALKNTWDSTSTDAGFEFFPSRALLFKIAKNIKIDKYRKDTLRHHENFDDHDVVAPLALEPSNLVNNSRLTVALLSAIDQLPPRCKEAFVLYKFENLSHSEIASRMNISRNMVEKHVIKGMIACKGCLDKYNQ